MKSGCLVKAYRLHVDAPAEAFWPLCVLGKAKPLVHYIVSLRARVEGDTRVRDGGESDEVRRQRARREAQ
jgi:hypothetical protein